jgi:hypothetical protein
MAQGGQTMPAEAPPRENQREDFIVWLSCQIRMDLAGIFLESGQYPVFGPNHYEM